MACAPAPEPVSDCSGAVDWLEALPHPAAILSLAGKDFCILSANPAFTQKLSVYINNNDDRRRRFQADWRDRIFSCMVSGNGLAHFEVREDGMLGPEYYSCTLGRLDQEQQGESRFLLTVIDRTGERMIERNFRRELLTDSLTALPNRAGFGEEIDDRLAHAPWPEGSGFAILCIDLARFSRVNESLGALAGDELIITVAKRLKSSLRQGDVLARIGGNEFAIFARLHNGLSDALHIVQRINDTLSSPVRLSNLQISVDCAIGCALSSSREDDPDDIVRQAQAAVKFAKRSGKLEIYRTGVLKEAHRRFTLESRLRDALANGGLELAFQPIVHLRSGEVAGFEALARWNDPELGAVSPAEFIPAAEESGLIVPLGRWAMHEAAQTLAKWDRMNGDPLPIRVSVNLSAIQMARDDVPSVLEEALRYSGIDGKRLTMELTESAIIADPDKARQVLSALKAMDASIAMDDFGTGYSNLASLQSLPIDVLKIDRSLVTGMLRDRDKTAIVKAILSLAESLGLRVTAEGIETRELADGLDRMGCWQGQGYYYSVPMMAAAAFDYWRARWNFETI
ncbi:bifunctional diguanylate cyclase/phosphodiesterase [Sphingobium aquiterrae]|uniref:putative bifunctional diguanylate cyclase/phosphodiesterase n=1 Tax=Sphingobium aquiterrae TaxID=2038656 RepID=UPI00301AE984